ncbi:unnamed protein product [Didymodactylos carnosus]|uniref:Condensation domain-containing protein n=1 Tax=Didymodactylos carnosus TaxID=1234261 RepID=A0A8S2E4J4_9BILA|nr:unnamed protein product [Didymodactylos carnosus]CAF3875579.1 unnamed protein product [Didymodactylos carnosus]
MWEEHGYVSIERLCTTSLLIIEKHSVLRAKLAYDIDSECLKQSIKPMLRNEQYYSFELSRIFTSEELDKILYNEDTSSLFFNLEQGIIFRCDEKILVRNDIIIFNFHHIAFDESSVNPFVNDFRLDYMNNALYIKTQSFEYIDYSIYERDMNMNEARQY